jgi:hypothetical protein
MNVAVRGDRGSCLTKLLAPHTYLFAVANGFGSIEGVPIAQNALERLLDETQRHTRRRNKRAKNFLTSALERVNEELHARTASHEDYVTAACSVTAVLLSENRAYLAHAGSTGAYLARDGYVVSLTKNDAFEDEHSAFAVLTRALCIAPDIDVASCSFTLNEGDTLVLTGKRLRETDERRRLTECFAYGPQAAADGDQIVIVRFQPDDREQVEEPAGAHPIRSVAVGVLASVLFYVMMCLH